MASPNLDQQTSISASSWSSPLNRSSTPSAWPAMSEVEVKRMPKFKRCKITQQQLSALMTNFGATRSPHFN